MDQHNCQAEGVFACGPLAITMMRVLPANFTVGGHLHEADHVTFVFKGRIRVAITRPDRSTDSAEYGAGEFFNVPKDYIHEITTLVDGTQYACVFVKGTEPLKVT